MTGPKPAGPGPIVPGGILPPPPGANASANATSANNTAGPGSVIPPPPGGLIRPGGMLPGMPGPIPIPGGANATGGGMTPPPTTMPGGPMINKPPGANGTNEAGPANSGSSSSGPSAGVFSEFEQCGGAGGNCKSHGDSACVDAVFPGKACKDGFECVRQNFFYRQCLKPDVIKTLGSAWITTAPAARADCPKGFVGFQQQCGGSGGACKEDSKLGGECKDAAAAGVCCETGTTCQRVNEYFWQCQGQPTNSAASN